jgi:hypothetical protein
MMNTPFLTLSPAQASTGSTPKAASIPDGQIGQQAQLPSESAANPFAPTLASAADAPLQATPHAFVIEFGDALNAKSSDTAAPAHEFFSEQSDVFVSPPQAKIPHHTPTAENRVEMTDETQINAELPPIAPASRPIPPLEMHFLAQPNQTIRPVSPEVATEVETAESLPNPAQPVAAPNVESSGAAHVLAAESRDITTAVIQIDAPDSLPANRADLETPHKPTAANAQNAASLANPLAAPAIAAGIEAPANLENAAIAQQTQNVPHADATPSAAAHASQQGDVQPQMSSGKQTTGAAPARSAEATNTPANPPITQAAVPTQKTTPADGAPVQIAVPATTVQPSALPLANAYSNGAIPTPPANTQNERRADWRPTQKSPAAAVSETALRPDVAPAPTDETAADSRQAQTTSTPAVSAVNAAPPKEASAVPVAQTTPFLSNTGVRPTQDRTAKTNTETQDYSTKTTTTGPLAGNTIPTPTTESVQGMFAQSTEKLDSLFPDASQSEVSFRAELGALESNRSAILQATRDFSQMRPDLARSVAQQLAQAATGDTDAPMELTLSPEELGRVRLTFSPTENGMAVSVMAERPETLELMRRNIDSLAQEFLGIGYEDVSFNFTQSGADQNSSDQQAPQNQAQSSNGLSNEPHLQDDQGPPPPVKVDLTQSDRLDIRL